MGANDYNRWRDIGAAYGAKSANGTSGQEIRWGDTHLFNVQIPAVGIGSLTVIPGKQLIQAATTPRVWNVGFYAALNPPILGDVWTLFWRVTVGVGNSALKRYASVGNTDIAPLIGAVFPGDLPSAQTSILNIPAGQLIVDTALLIQSAVATASARSFQLTSAAQAAPIER